MGKKENVFDYIEWRGDLSFQQSAFNEIDGLILSIFAYLDFSFIGSEIVFFRDAVRKINVMPDEQKLNGPGIIMENVVSLANAAANSERYSNMGVYKFVDITDEELEIQFAAVTFLLPDTTVFISFRGTDNTLVGWKEDLNMCFIDGIPSQIEAAKYVEAIAQEIDMPLRLGGHSKGGNLSIWASAHLDSKHKQRIINIYSNDAPGFNENFLKASFYLEIREKICSFVPESSIVGVLMEHDSYTIIRSSSPSLLQHNPFSWLVSGKCFVYDDSRTLSGKQFEKIINSWIKAMSVEEREELIENIYDIVTSSDARTLEDFDKTKIKSIISMSRTFREMGLRKQAQLVFSLSKILFNSDILLNNNLKNLLLETSD
nr:Mbeg1-like protein [uncultured Faecalimonas sp.]